MAIIAMPPCMAWLHIAAIKMCLVLSHYDTVIDFNHLEKLAAYILRLAEPLPLEHFAQNPKSLACPSMLRYQNLPGGSKLKLTCSGLQRARKWSCCCTSNFLLVSDGPRQTA